MQLKIVNMAIRYRQYTRFNRIGEGLKMQRLTRRLTIIGAFATGLFTAVGFWWRRRFPAVTAGPTTAALPKGDFSMTPFRTIARIIPRRPTVEGAGVRLNRLFGFGDEAEMDPFLLMDHFGSDKPEDYLAGFPWHPHRGMETITYVLEGEVAHGDSLGNSGTITAGDLQWMTAGSGIIHQEMPKGNADGRMSGFQLWANLPKTQKMTAPKYRDIASHDIPSHPLENGGTVRVIAGSYNGTDGPMDDIVIQPEYLDIALTGGGAIQHPTPLGHTVFAYIFEGTAAFADTTVTSGHLIRFSDGAAVSIEASEAGARLLLISGKPLDEPVAWRGPIVMNTEEELHTAFEEYRNGTFIKKI